MYINPILGGFLLCMLCEVALVIIAIIAYAIYYHHQYKGGPKK